MERDQTTQLLVLLERLTVATERIALALEANPLPKILIIPSDVDINSVADELARFLTAQQGGETVVKG